MGVSAAEAIATGVPRMLALEAAARASLAANVPEPMSRLGPAFALAWAENGFATIEPSHRLAASLMATSIPQEHVDEFVRMPWRCFGFHVPNGLLGEQPAFALVLHSRDGQYQMLSIHEREFHYGVEKSIADWNIKIVRNEVNDNTFTPQDMRRANREIELMGRLFLGICAEMSAHRPSGDITSGGIARDAKNRPIPHTFKLIRDVKVDARRAVRDYAEGRSGRGPSVQVLVRGHWKAQAFGPGLAERKIIHVEPYWRGPEDAPVAIRAHKLDE